MKSLDPQNFLRLARSIPDDSRVPYSFEKRILARIRQASSPQPDLSATWAKFLWKAAAVCLAISLATGVLASFIDAPAPAPPSILSIELEETVLAPIVLEQEAW